MIYIYFVPVTACYLEWSRACGGVAARGGPGEVKLGVGIPGPAARRRPLCKVASRLAGRVREQLGGIEEKGLLRTAVPRTALGQVFWRSRVRGSSDAWPPLQKGIRCSPEFDTFLGIRYSELGAHLTSDVVELPEEGGPMFANIWHFSRHPPLRGSDQVCDEPKVSA